MKYFGFGFYVLTGLSFFNFGCNGNQDSAAESEIMPSPVNADCQSEIFTLFLSLPDSVFKNDPTFDRQQIEDLVCKSNAQLPEYSWKHYMISESKMLLSLYHNVEPVSYDFIDCENGGLLLFQQNGDQKLTHFLYDENTKIWSAGYEIPFPSETDFYSDLTGLDQNYILEWGLPMMYPMQDGKGIEFMLMQKAQQDSLGNQISIPPSDMYFELHWNQDSLWLEKYLLEVSPVAFR